MALTDAERAARYRANKAAGRPSIQYRRPADRRRRPARWADAIAELYAILDGYEKWQEAMPESLADSATAARLEETLALRELVDDLAAATLPKGFGRD